MSWITEREFEVLYPEEVCARVAKQLQIESEEGRTKVRDDVLRIARSYDTGLSEAKTRPIRKELRGDLERIRRLCRELSLAIIQSHSQAKWEVAHALSLVRGLLKKTSGVPMIPYEYGISNQWVFEQQSLRLLVEELANIQAHLSQESHRLKKGGRPPGPERDAIQTLLALWMTRHNELPKLTGKAGRYSGDFVEFCETILRPIAVRHGRNPNFGSLAHKALYVHDRPNKTVLLRHSRFASEPDEA